MHPVHRFIGARGAPYWMCQVVSVWNAVGCTPCTVSLVRKGTLQLVIRWSLYQGLDQLLCPRMVAALPVDLTAVAALQELVIITPCLWFQLLDDRLLVDYLQAAVAA